MAEKATKANATEEKVVAERREIDPNDEYVEVILFKDGKDYKDDVFVAVNGRGLQIKRGVPVRIQRKYALALEDGRAQDVMAVEISDKYHSEYAAMMRNI